MVLQLAFGIILLIIILPTYPRASAQDYPDPITVKAGCNATCGGVYISYPFGMEDPKCYVNGWFEIECRETSEGGHKPYLKSLNLEVRMTLVTRGLVDIMNPIFHWNCQSKETTQAMINLRGSPFVYSQSRNKFMAVGCNKLAFLQSNGTSVGGCVSICGGSEDARDTNTINMMYTGSNDDGCHGRYCCENSLPSYLSEYNATLQDFKNDNSSSSSSSVSGECSSAAIVDEYWPQVQYTSSRVSDLNGMDYVPAVSDLNGMDYVRAVIEWEIWEMLANHTIQLYPDSNCFNLTNSLNQYNGWECDCPIGFAGNPFLSHGCAGILSSLGSIIFLLGLWLLYKVVRKIIIKKRKQKFFKKNGGLLLQQTMSSNKVNADKDILFSLDDLEKATDHFNKNRVLGRGGQGTVYKGMLVNGRIVAVKKFKVEGNVEEFINEFIILSQINNRNVVKLLGCCLETKIPLLVYEFIPNGNLFEYLHNQSEELPITWDMRLRIAMEIAGALFYLHSMASKPIFHRDIKSTNILLDEKYRAKIADFGASRIISIEDTHLTTMVQGTFGYLDPEYFRSSQFTEKSDVYSFGVVLVELLTCQKPIFVVEYEGYKSLASYFVECMEKDNLLDIIDKRVVKEVKNGQIIAVANLAKRCLELNGRKRPTMKELTFELERIQKLEKNSNTEQNHKKS
ncbi:hypothetical protein Fmac_009516 [Flemingia macrophylla]|uniref:Protein kinase domain-containing protein n=1 Tax=Flemingia macrophylla TaxID=520843 RepID=A0ABD1N0H3_9FABA